MSRRKGLVTIAKVNKYNNQNFLARFKLGESYTSLILGIVVVIISSVLVVSFAKNNSRKALDTAKQETLSQNTEKIKENPKLFAKTYTVLPGEDLWSISEKVYKSGYNWVDIAKANNLQNPDLIYKNTILKLPEVKPIIVKANVQANLNESKIDSTTVVETKSELKEEVKTITQGKYIVQRGDYLWQIAVRAYGDGYKWVDIARVNNLSEPNMIFSGNELKIPR